MKNALPTTLLAVFCTLVPETSLFAQLTDTGNRAGIGNNEPCYKLDVQTDTLNGGMAFRLFQPDSLWIGMGFGGGTFETLPDSVAWLGHQMVDNSFGGLALVSAGKRPGYRYDGIHFWTGPESAPKQRMVVAPNGRVGIGKLRPKANLDVKGVVHATRMSIGKDPNPIADNGYALSVNGGIKTKEIQVTQLEWADFVFDPDYPLMPLADVEAFTKQYRHLPEVPSEQEVLASGIEVGQMQALLLQKVEELTLYVIALEKEVKALKAEQEGEDGQ